MLEHWVTYRNLLKEEGGEFKLKQFKDLSGMLTMWIQYSHLNEVFEMDGKWGTSISTRERLARL